MIQFAWDIHFSCNYACPYCWFFGKWEDIKVNNIYPDLEKLIKTWENIHDKYGKAHIEIAGGEPLTYPEFQELIIELAKLHDIGITTNLSMDIDKILFSSSKFNIGMSFHPLFADFKTFIKRAAKVKKYGFGRNVLYLAYPPQVDKIPFYKEAFEKEGLEFSVLTFWGKYKGADYPESYTEKEKDIIKTALGVRSESKEKFQLTPQFTRGKLCNAGHTYALIHPNGKAYRCGGGNWKEQHQPFGNILDDGFTLLDKAEPCEVDNCPCNEWSFLLIK